MVRAHYKSAFLSFICEIHDTRTVNSAEVDDDSIPILTTDPMVGCTLSAFISSLVCHCKTIPTILYIKESNK